MKSQTLTKLGSFFLAFASDRSGATAIEYAMIITFVALAIVAGIDQIGSALVGIFAAVLAGFT